MLEMIDEEVDVIMYYSSKRKQAVPHLLNWQNKQYFLEVIDYAHNYKEGRDTQHIFELVDKDHVIWFRLRLDSSNLHWTLERIHDGNPN